MFLSSARIETPKYAFFVDVTFDDYRDYAKAKAIIEIMAEELHKDKSWIGEDLIDFYSLPMAMEASRSI